MDPGVGAGAGFGGPPPWLLQGWINLILNWAWLSDRTLGILAMSAPFVSLTELYHLIIQKLREEAYKNVLLLSMVCVLLIMFSLWMMVTQIYIQWIHFAAEYLHQRGWREILPSWLVCFLIINSAIFVVKLDPLLHLIMARSLAITLVAMLSIAYQRRDPSGLSYGLIYCFLVCSLIFFKQTYMEKVSQHKEHHLITSLVTFLVCHLCVVPPPSPPDEAVQAAGQPPPPPPDEALQALMNLLSLIDSLVTLFFVVSFAFKVTLSGHIMKGINDGRNHSLSVSGSKNSDNSSSSFQSSKLVPTDNKLKVQSDLPQGVSEEKGAGCYIKVEHGLKVGMSEKVGSKRIRLEMSASSAPLEDGVICASTADPVLRAPVVTSPQDGEMESCIQKDGYEKDIQAAHRRSIDNTTGVCETSLEGQRKPALDQAGLPARTENLVPSELDEDQGNLKARVCRELGEECCTDVQLTGAPWIMSVGGGDNACVSCKFGGTLLCCNVEQKYHLKYLDPPLKNVPIGVWHCVCCVKKKVVSGVHSLSGGVGSILDAKEVELTDSEGVEKQYLVKDRCLAHIHNSWVPELKLEALVLG